MLFSEPGAAVVTLLPGNQAFTLWDRWEVRLADALNATLSQFLTAFTESYRLTPTGVFHGAAMIYMSGLPGQAAKLSKPYSTLFYFNFRNHI